MMIPELQSLITALLLCTIRPVADVPAEVRVMTERARACFSAFEPAEAALRRLWTARRQKATLQKRVLGDSFVSLMRRGGALTWAGGDEAVERLMRQMRQVEKDQVDEAKGACGHCSLGVAKGLECATCGRAWHWGCAVASLGANVLAHAQALQLGVFFADRTVDFKCVLCAAGGTERGPLLEAFRSKVKRMTVQDAEEMAKEAEAAGPSRKRLPAPRGPQAGGARSLAVAVVRELVDMSMAGSPAAEVMLAFAPKIFFRKGRSIRDQVGDFVDSKVVPTTYTAIDEAHAWAASVEAAMMDERPARAAAKVDRGPGRGGVKAADCDMGRLFPKQEMPVRETERLQQLRRRFNAPRCALDLAALKKWARTHTTSSGGRTGWTGSLLLAVCASKGGAAMAFAALLARPPDDWRSKFARDTLFRACDGWLTKKTDGVRPIAAPQFLRRVLSAVATKRSWTVVERYCSERGQWGLSSDAATIVYSLLPMLTAATGGTVLVADRSQSYQTFRRSAIVDALEDLASKQQPSCSATAALLDGVIDMWACGGDLPVTNVSFHGVPTTEVGALPQGCALSATLEAITLAHHAGVLAPQPPQGVVTKAAHDDLCVSAQKGADVEAIDVPDTSQVGGEYNTAKSQTVGEGASRLREKGLAAHVTERVTVWGRPVTVPGAMGDWFEEVLLKKVENRVSKLLALAEVDRALAIWCAHAVGGPAAMTAHVARGVPPSMMAASRWGADKAWSALRRMDELWEGLMIQLTGRSVESLSPQEAERAKRQVWSAGGLGHKKAVDHWEAASTDGLMGAIKLLTETATQGGIDMRPWAEPLGWAWLAQMPGQQPTAEECDDFVASLAKRAAALRRRTRVADDTDPAAAVNLWKQALTAPTRLHEAAEAAVMGAFAEKKRSLAVAAALGTGAQGERR